MPRTKELSGSSPKSQTINIKGDVGAVNIHLSGHDALQAAGWDAVAMSPEAKALLQRHEVKASTALKMHDMLGFEDVADLRRLSPDLVAQLKLRPLQLEPLVQLLRDQQLQQGTELQAQQAAKQGAAAAAVDGIPAIAGGAKAAAPTPAAGLAAKAGAAVEPRSQAAAGGGLHRHVCLANLKGEPGTVKQVAITPNGRRAVTAGPGNYVQVWDLEYRSRLAALGGHTNDVAAVAITPDSRRAVSSSKDRTLRVWDLHTYACTATLDRYCSAARAVAIAPDGLHVLYGHGGKLMKWAVGASRAWELDRCANPIEGIAVAPDGRLAVTNGRGDSLRVWDLSEGKLAGTIGGHVQWVKSLAISADSRHVLTVSGSSESSLSVWDLKTRALVGTLEGHTDEVTCVAITPDGRRAVSGSADRTLRVWDLATRTCVGMMDELEAAAWVECVAVTPNGRFAVSGGKDLRVWDLAPASAPAVPVATEVPVVPAVSKAVAGSSEEPAWLTVLKGLGGMAVMLVVMAGCVALLALLWWRIVVADSC